MAFGCEFGVNLAPLKKLPKSILGGSLGRLGRNLGRLGVSWAVLGWSWSPLGPSSGVLWASWASSWSASRKINSSRVCLVAGAQGPPIRILYDFPDHFKDIRIRILLGYGILHAMLRHKAWRGGYIQRAAELRTRLRA